MKVKRIISVNGVGVGLDRVSLDQDGKGGQFLGIGCFGRFGRFGRFGLLDKIAAENRTYDGTDKESIRGRLQITGMASDEK